MRTDPALAAVLLFCTALIGCGGGDGPPWRPIVPEDPPLLAWSPVFAAGLPPAAANDPHRTQSSFLAAHTTAAGEIYDFAADGHLYRRGAGADGVWTHVGPLPADGYPFALIAPSDGQRIYFRDPSGWYVSRDGGVSWESRGEDYAYVGLHPFDADVVFARLYPNPPDPSSRLYRSDDAGATFAPLGEMLPGAQVSPLAVVCDPRDPARLLVGAAGAHGVYVSDDGGQTWTRRLTTHYGVSDLTLCPTRPDVVLAVDYFNVHRSVDSGRTWTRLFQSPGDPGLFRYAGGPDGALVGSKPLRWSTDDGETWEFAEFGVMPRMVASHGEAGFYLMPDNWGIYGFDAAEPGVLSPAGAGFAPAAARGRTRLCTDGAGYLYADTGERAVLRKAPGDTTWTVVPVPLYEAALLVHGNHRSAGVQVVGWAGDGMTSDYALAASADAGQTWTYAAGPPRRSAEVVAAPWDSRTLISRSETRSPGVDVSRDGGATWTTYILGDQDLRVLVRSDDPEVVVAIAENQFHVCDGNPSRWTTYATGTSYLQGVLIDGRFEPPFAIVSRDSLRTREGPPGNWVVRPEYGRVYAAGRAVAAPWNPALSLVPWRDDLGTGLMIIGGARPRRVLTPAAVSDMEPDGDVMWYFTAEGLRRGAVADLQ